ncbi:hypothetical protein O181_042353 [Austropuccinia psidii MF-1]|uniref:Uncharacterized protein n=1 Tax=Austropuccinia psidii MF-1 TaxID=1389203 RepID=A0A9Q3DJ85_9BASI|nr:hypothetical protein [Austropuccinia psidii MF-1]
MDWVTALPVDGEKRYNAYLAIVDSYRKNPISLPSHRYEKDMDNALLIWNRAISHTGLLKSIISNIEPKFTSALWTNLPTLLGTKLSFSTADHLKTDELEKIMIQTLEEILRSVFTCGPELKDSHGFAYDWCTLLSELEVASKTSIHPSTGNLLQSWREDGTPNFQLIL